MPLTGKTEPCRWDNGPLVWSANKRKTNASSQLSAFRSTVFRSRLLTKLQYSNRNLNSAQPYVVYLLSLSWLVYRHWSRAHASQSASSLYVYIGGLCMSEKGRVQSPVFINDRMDADSNSLWEASLWMIIVPVVELTSDCFTAVNDMIWSSRDRIR